jgi:hypothetical protein
MNGERANLVSRVPTLMGESLCHWLITPEYYLVIPPWRSAGTKLGPAVPPRTGVELRTCNDAECLSGQMPFCCKFSVTVPKHSGIIST